MAIEFAAPVLATLSEYARADLASAVAALPEFPRQRVGRKSRWNQWRHINVVHLGVPSTPVFLKSYSIRKCEWGLNRVEHRVLETLCNTIRTEVPFSFPEPICYLENERVLATTVLPGRPIKHWLYVYGLTRLRTSKLLDWSSRLGTGWATLQRVASKLDLGGLPKKELNAEGVRQKARNVCILVQSGLASEMAKRAGLLDQAPQGLAHGDLGIQNILVHNDNFGLIDWEYASVRSVFRDPLHLALSILFSQRWGVRKRTAIAMATTLLSSWLQAADLPYSSDERSTMLKLELCRTFCADGVDERIVKKWPKIAAQLTTIVCELRLPN